MQLEQLECRIVPTVLDLSTAPGLSGMINGAIFTGATGHIVSGSGVIDSFNRLQNKGVEAGLNTDYPAFILNNLNKGGQTFNHSLQLNSLPVVVKGAITYYEFVLDINQDHANPLLSLDELRFYVTPPATPSPNELHNYDPATLKLDGLSPVYDMDGGPDPSDSTYVKLNSRFSTGSGSLDMFLDVPTSDFGTDLSQYVYLYSKFGVQLLNGKADEKNGGSANGGFEEWARGKGAPIQVSAQVATLIDEVSPVAQTGVTKVPAGSVVHDSSTLTFPSGGPTPTGTVIYDFFNNPTCSGTPISTQTVTISNGKVPVSSDTPPLAAGSYSYMAMYSGDNNYMGSVSACEPLTVAQAAVTIITNSGGTIVLGSGAALTDSATLSGGSSPTGTITFTLTAPGGGVVDTEVVSVNGNGTYSTPKGFVPTGSGILTGTYQWMASYSGDANNNGVSSKFGDEPETVSPASPRITTNAGETVVLGSGVALTDSATLSGGAFFLSGGTITFTLTAPGGSLVDTEVVVVSGNGTYSTPHGYVPTVAGTFQWVASYSGDANNNGVSSKFGDEPETVTSPGAPRITTSAGGTIVLGSGAALTDSATLSGGSSPTGTITFTLTAPGGGVVDTEVVSVSGNGTYSTPKGFVPTGLGILTGTYQWVASYSGDANNNGVSSKFGDEPETVSPASPRITTTPHPSECTLGSVTLTDTATLSGGFNPAGSITFTLYAPGDGVVDTETVTVHGNGTYSTPKGYLPILAGTYQWVAGYSGDGNNGGASSNFGDEPVAVNKANPQINTTPGGTVVLGSGVALTDTATLSGGAFFLLGGTITFTLYAPDNSIVDTEVVTVTGNGTYSTPHGYVPTKTGTYQWVASYGGDANNNGTTSPFGAEPETVTGPAGPTITTTPGGTVALGSGVPLTDSATLSGGNSPTGTITFTLYAPGDGVVDTEAVTVSGNGTYSTPHGFVPTVTGTYQWVASYSGDAHNNPVSSNKGDEPETVSPASPTITTTPNPSNCTLGTMTLFDSATLSGGFNPAGTITFTLYAPGDGIVDTEAVTVSGNGTYSTPHGFVPTVAGTYQWVASYRGDGNNGGASSNFGDEPVTLNKASPQISTTPGGAVVLGSGAALTDSATLSGGAFFLPGGTITFTLYAPGDGIVDTEVVSVTGDGTYTTPKGYVPTAVGVYQWVATYSGDANNFGASSNFGDEPETVTGPVAPTITTTPGGTIVLGSGAALTDSATLSGGSSPTGTITFTLYAPGGGVVDTETVTVNGAGTYTTPAGYVPAGSGILTGTYQWVASYSGDANNNGVSSKFGDEPETVSPASPTISTTPNPSGCTLGDVMTLTDSATLSGGFNPTGTITFTLYAPGDGVVDTEVVTVTGNGTYSTPKGYVPTVAGTYQWVASYSGDGNNNGASSNFGDEPVTLNKASPQISTTPGGTVVLGSGAVLTDSATLSGGAFFLPGGTITFTLYAPGDGIVDTEVVSVTGDGTYTTPKGYVPSAVGVYQWVATYSGDANNFGASSNFGDEPETVTGPAAPTITTTPNPSNCTLGSVTLTDSATLSGGLSPTGTITFTLYAPGDGIVDTETITVHGDGTYSTPKGYVPTMAGIYQWVASYSGDANNNGVSSNFGDEPVTLNKASPQISTTPGGTVVLGSGAALTDSATLSGGVFFLPGGTITFTLYAPGGGVVDTEVVSVSGNGAYSTPKGYVPTVAGTYQWVASYSGDANNNGASSPFGAEPETVTGPGGPSITTTPGGTIVLGSGAALTDSATLSGGNSPTGTITFTLYAPGGGVVDTETVTVHGNGTYSTPKGYVPTGSGPLTGTYQWVASYSGDANNNGVSSNKGDEPETVSRANPQIVTTAGGTVVLGSGAALSDSATLSGGAFFLPGGTITFTLYAPGGGLVDTEVVSVTGDGTYSTPKGYVPSAAGTYQWVASYSGDANNNGASSNFGDEPETVTNQPGPPVSTGQTATIGFWHNKNGQALIDSFNGGPTSTALATWLATTFPNLFGASAGANSLVGKTNADVAALFLSFFGVSGQKTEAQFLAVALAVYATTSSLGGTAAVPYGFMVTSAGLGNSTFNVGSNGAAFGVPNGTTLTVMQILLAANAMSSNGKLYNGNTTLLNEANTVLDAINQAGDIG